MSSVPSYRKFLLAGIFCAGASLVSALAAETTAKSEAIPDFTAPGTGWTMINSNATDYVNPPSGPITVPIFASLVWWAYRPRK